MVESPSFGEALRVWARIGLLSFGGPAGQIALMHRILVEEKRWLDEARFLHALNFCMLLPGPEAQQLAVYVGWLLHRVRGGLVAGTLFVLPGAVVMLLLSLFYSAFSEQALVQGLFLGVKAAVLAVVIEAVLRIGRRALGSVERHAVAALAFVAIFCFAVPFPVIVLAAGLAGLIAAGLRPRLFAAAASTETGGPLVAETQAARSPGRLLRVLAIGLGLWFGPTLVLLAWLGPDSVFVQEGFFFSKMAVVTFGGAYAVLAYVAQQAVELYGWLGPGEMLDGLGLAETTPGPLIMVVQFVGFLGAARQAIGLEPWLAGTLGALLTTWVTFVPCFLWIFLGAPFVEALRGNRQVAAALAAITAAVVGVILNLAVWFALHLIFARLEETEFFAMTLLLPDWSSLQAGAALLSAMALVAMLRFKLGLLPTLGAAALLGMALELLT